MPGGRSTVLAIGLCLLLVPSVVGSFDAILAVLDPFYLAFYAVGTQHQGLAQIRNSPHAQTPPAPALIPFAEGLSVQSSSAGGTVFVRASDGSYAGLRFSPGPPITLLSPASQLAQLLSGGPGAIVNTSPALAGVGAQSQRSGLSPLLKNGLVMYAIASGNDSSVSIAPSSGAAAALFPIGPDVNSLLFADFNNDGNPDLAVAFDGSVSVPGGIAVLLGKADGTFASPVVYASGTQATHFAVLDLNHDGKLDIATASLDRNVTVLVGKGDGTFASPLKVSAGGSGEAIAIADVNGDGNPDIVAGGTLGILLGKGDGTFQAGSPLPANASGTYIWAIAAGDLNNDGKIDLAFADIENQTVSPLFGNGDGTFRLGQAYAVSLQPNFLVLADYNHDGRLDIINGSGDERVFGISNTSGNTDILVNNGDGTFQGVPAYFTLPDMQAAGNSSLTSAIVTGKFGGAAQGVVASGFGGLTLFPGNGKGGFQTAQSISFNGSARALAAADFNGDGKTDVAVASGNNVAVLIGTSSGFASAVSIPFGGTFATAITTGDFDGDGKIDIAVMSSGTPGTLALLKGNGDGSFRAPVNVAAGTTPTYLAAADLNGDGKLDLVFSDSGAAGTGAVYVVMNLGGGVFQTPTNVFSGIFPTFGIGDVDGDGHPDLVVGNNAVGGAVSWLPGVGNGTFKAAGSIASTDNINSILVQDFNGDGHADLVLAHLNSNAAFLSGNGDGTFSAEAELLGGDEPSLLQSADLNGDGKPDLVVGGYTINLLLNNSLPLVSTVNSASFTNAVSPNSIATVFGSDLANGTALTNSTVTLTDASGAAQACTLFYVSPGQINFLIPASAVTGQATLNVKSGDGTVSQGPVNLTTVGPGIYTANGTLAAALAVTTDAALNQTTTILVSANPAGTLVTAPINLDPPSNTVYLILYGTGIRGASLSQVSVKVGSQTISPAYAGAAPGFPGEDQINVLLPHALKGSGDTAITVTVAGQVTNTVHIQIQ